MKCSKCSETAVLSDPSLCKDHFIDYFEKKVFSTIRKHKLISKNDRVCVAASGGKDSTTALYLVNKFLNSNARILALVVDEGISVYRSETINNVKRFCEENKIPIKIISFEQEFGHSLDEILGSGKTIQKPCTVCGTLRRYLLNKYASGFDVIVTGHNLDDESEAVIMNLFRHQVDVLARLGPSSGISRRKGFVQRVKPLYFCSEKEVILYATIMGFNLPPKKCPNIVHSYRADVRKMLNDYELSNKGTKLNIISSFLAMLPKLKEQFRNSAPLSCASCGEPSSGKICNACSLISKIKHAESL